MWVAIILLGRERRVSGQHTEVLAAIQQRLDQLEDVDQRLAEVEERLDRMNNLLSKQKEALRAPGPSRLSSD